MRGRLIALSLAATLAGLLGCDLRPPYVILTIKDPMSIATDADRVRVTAFEEPFERALGSHTFPTSVTLTAEHDGQTDTIVEALRGEAVVARARVHLSFVRGQPGGEVAELERACAIDADCNDGVSCNGTETCAEGICQSGQALCPPSLFACVEVECVEAAQKCSTNIDHTKCAPIVGSNGAPTPTYCDPGKGCVAGKACKDSIDCQDGSVCNGSEQCESEHCIGGIPLEKDDGDSCTIDICDDASGGAVHVPDPALIGATCSSTSVQDGICAGKKCVLSRCGDGVVDRRVEDCEDGNDNPNDGCDRCRSTSWTPIVLSGLRRAGGDPLATTVNPSYVAIDLADNIFFSADDTVWRIDAKTGTITIAAGQVHRSGGCPSGMCFTGDSGPAASAVLNMPRGVAVDGLGNLYIADTGNARVRRVDAHTGTIETVAGGGVVDVGDGGDASSAVLRSLSGIAIDPGGTNLYIAEEGTHRVRKIDLSSRRIYSFAGTGSYGFSGEGQDASLARLYFPSSIAVDRNGYVFICENANYIVSVVWPDHTIHRIAGSRTSTASPTPNGDSGDGGYARDADLFSPLGLTFDARGNLYLSSLAQVRMITTPTSSNARIYGVAGTTQGYGGDGGLARAAKFVGMRGVAIRSSGEIVVADSGNLRLRSIYQDARDPRGTLRVRTIAGLGASGLSLHPDSAALSTDVEFTVIAPDGSGGFYGAAQTNSQDGTVILRASDGTGRIVLGDPDFSSCQQVTGIGSAGLDALSTCVSYLDGLYLRGSKLEFLIADAELNLDLGDSRIYGGANYFGIGRDLAFDSRGRALVATGASLQRIDFMGGAANDVFMPGQFGVDAIAIDSSDNIYFADKNAHCVRRMDAATSSITTFVGECGRSGVGGPVNSPRLSYPRSLTINPLDGKLYIAEGSSASSSFIDCRVRVFASASQTLSLYAGGNVCGASGDGGPANAAVLGTIQQIRFDVHGDLFIDMPAVHRVAKVDHRDQTITTIVGPIVPGDGALARGQIESPTALTPFDADRFLIAGGGEAGRVWLADMTQRTVLTVAGYPQTAPTNEDFAQYVALLRDPAGIAYDPSSKRIYVSERGAARIRYIDASSLSTTAWKIHSFAGVDGDPGYSEGPAATSQFNRPSGLALDAARGVLYVADAGNHVVRAIPLSGTGSVSVVAGVVGSRGIPPWLNAPTALAIGSDGHLYVADADNNLVLRIETDGHLTVVLGDRTESSSGNAVDHPLGLAVDSFGDLFSTSRGTVRVVGANQTLFTIYGSGERDRFPQAVTNCLSGIASAPGSAAEDRFFVLDGCQGMLLELDRKRR